MYETTGYSKQTEIYDANAEHLQSASNAAHLVHLNCVDSHTTLKHLETTEIL
jgi:hypothetical protein